MPFGYWLRTPVFTALTCVIAYVRLLHLQLLCCLEKRERDCVLSAYLLTPKLHLQASVQYVSAIVVSS